jgi:hypothetical protein
MSRHNRISCVEQADGSIDVVVPAGMAALFQELVSRATRSWQDQHPEIRDFADRLLKRDHIVGSNMKEGLGEKVEVQVPVPRDTTLAKRSCCGTILCEPHHTQCSEVTGRYIAPVIPKSKQPCTKCHINPCYCSWAGN